MTGMISETKFLLMFAYLCTGRWTRMGCCLRSTPSSGLRISPTGGAIPVWISSPGNDLDLGIYGDRDMTGIDFLFIDTDHTYAQASQEWELYLPLLSPTAIVAFDDITMNDMARFWDPLGCAKLETGTSYHYTGFGLAAP